MITTGSIVALIASLGWLILSWGNFRSASREAGWTGSRQLMLAAVWVAIFASVTLFIRYMSQ